MPLRPKVPPGGIVEVSAPTNLAAGSEASGTQTQVATPRWMIFATNVGGATAGPATVTDTLPAGVEASASLAPQISTSAGAGRTTKTCPVSGQTVTCEVSEYACRPEG